jgi:pimeloyl-ACP methyl ester carboxylesterase/putative sterol carrier protein
MGDSITALVQRLPSRFIGSEAPLSRTRFRLGIGRQSFDVVLTDKWCVVEEPGDDDPDVTISTDSATWRAIDSGKMSGIEAFADRKVSVKGSIEKSLLFEPLFDRPDRGGFRYSLRRVSLGGTEIFALRGGVQGGTPLILIHGLGATKASWLPVVPALAQDYDVYALDLPGFGGSSKPRGKYDAKFFADHVFRFMDIEGIDRAFIAGNSMGGRVAMEMGMQEPERVAAITCLCPAAAFTKRPWLRVVRLLRPELGIGALMLPRKRLKEELMHLFYKPGRIGDDWYEAAIDDFLDYWKSPRARMAFFASLRNIYLDEPQGENGFWDRLSDMRTPALFIYGRRDVLITSRFGRKVKKALPNARVETWDDCGHVPQLEFPERTVDHMLEFLKRAEISEQAV